MSINKKRSSLLALTAIVFSFSPFFSLYPIHTDVQPVFFLVIVAYAATRKKIFIRSWPEFIFLLIALLSLFYIDPSHPYFSLRHSLSFIVAFAVYWFFSRNLFLITQKLIFIIVMVSFSALLFHYLLPEIFSETVGSFVRKIKIINMSGARGASGLAAEPGFMGGLAVFYIAMAKYLKEERGDRSYFSLNVMICVVMIGLTKSGTGGLLLLLFLATIYLKPNLRSVLIGVGVIFLLYWLSVNTGFFGRAGYAVRGVFTDPRHLFLIDASIAQRVMNLAVGFFSIFSSPFGAGAGSYERVAEAVVTNHGLADHIQGGSGNISAFAKYTVELGLFFWFFLLYFSLAAIRRMGFKSLPYLITAMFFISASFSIIFPPTWILFALMHTGSVRSKAYRLYQ